MKINGHQIPEMDPQSTQSGNGYGGHLTEEEKQSIAKENERRGLAHLIKERNANLHGGPFIMGKRA